MLAVLKKKVFFLHSEQGDRFPLSVFSKYFDAVIKFD